MKCPYCFYEIEGSRHTMLCPYRPENVRKIVFFLRDYVLTKSKFNKQFCPFPSPRELDIFCRQNKIARVKTIANRYLDKDTKLTDWLTELLDYSLYNNIITREQFPAFVLFLYDSWIFYPREQYQQLYEESVVYEDGDPLSREIFDSHFTSSATIERLRTQGKLFTEKQTPVTEFLA